MNNVVFTISRQYGSGGRNVGIALAKALNIPFYDNELLHMAAEKSNLHPDIAMDADESIKKGFFGMFTTAPFISDTGMNPTTELPINDRLFIEQSNLIKELANQGSCVIVGRCADYILENEPNVVNVFVHACEDQRIVKIQAEQNVSEKEARKLMEKVDKRRATYYNYYSNRKWGIAENYHLSIDSKIGYDNCVKLILAYTDMM